MFKIRASAAGKIMTNPRSKSETLSQTCITFLEEWHFGFKYGRIQDIVTDPMIKGRLVEEASITLLQKYEKNKILYRKNEDHLSNDWATGTPDLVSKDEVVDIKSAWDFWTFQKAQGPYTKGGNLTDYGWQLMVYMWLTGKKKARLAYCLVNTPDYLVEGECMRQKFKFPGIDIDSNEDYLSLCDNIRANHFVDDIPEQDRVKTWEVEYDESKIEALKDRVEECRNYIESL